MLDLLGCILDASPNEKASFFSKNMESQKIENQEESAFFECSCFSHAMHVSKFKEEEEIYISVWERGINNGKLSVWQRIRYAFKIIKDGKPYGDEVVLSKNTSLRLVRFLKNLNAK